MASSNRVALSFAFARLENAEKYPGFGTNPVVASDIPWTTVHFQAIRELEREANRQSWT